jgi:hypothetical protein
MTDYYKRWSEEEEEEEDLFYNRREFDSDSELWRRAAVHSI